MPSDAIYVCAYTNKQFKSQAAYDNYLKSKKYKQLVAQATKAESARTAAADAAGPSEPTGGAADAAVACSDGGRGRARGDVSRTLSGNKCRAGGEL